jgi:hypothetical protein
MHNNTECQGTGVEGRESGEVSANLFPISMLDVGCSLLDVPPIPPPPSFDETHASQARSDLIQFTKIFFGLDTNVPPIPEI